MRNEDSIFRLDEIKDYIDEVMSSLRVDTSLCIDELNVEEIRSML